MNIFELAANIIKALSKKSRALTFDEQKAYGKALGIINEAFDEWQEVKIGEPENSTEEFSRQI